MASAALLATTQQALPRMRVRRCGSLRLLTLSRELWACLGMW